MKYELALTTARTLLADLAPACVQIEIAGGIRRMKPDPHDIELVAVPRIAPITTNFFGEVMEDYSLLDERLGAMINDGRLEAAGKNGPRYKLFRLPASGAVVDLFVVLPPAQWGYIYAIRTGPAHYSQWLVTERSRGGAKPDDLRASQGALWRNMDLIETPTEASFFAALGLDMPAPRDREPRWGLFVEEAL